MSVSIYKLASVSERAYVSCATAKQETVCEPHQVNSPFDYMYQINDPTGMSCMVFRVDTCYVMAFRGTEVDLRDLINNAQFGFASKAMSQIQPAIKAANDMIQRFDRSSQRIVFTGHSLGGILAKIVGWSLTRDALAFNSPSIYGATLPNRSSIVSKNSRCKIQTVVREGDGISNLGIHAVVEDPPIRVGDAHPQCHQPDRPVASHYVCYHKISTMLETLRQSQAYFF